ncbi:hypothetical protein, partial [Pseudomonas aeruginosa]|uniref:hypothetical protein n=1 Tax=Pseudomonas aeruginosa TaxID=287 RepID=UPI0034E2D69B
MIYWHHAKPYRSNDEFSGVHKAYDFLAKNISNEQFENIIKQTTSLLKRINSVAKHYEDIDVIEKNLNWEIESFADQLEDFNYIY